MDNSFVKTWHGGDRNSMRGADQKWWSALTSPLTRNAPMRGDAQDVDDLTLGKMLT